MVGALRRNGVLKSPRTEAAMLAIDRGDFVTTQLQGSAYEDRPLPIGSAVTISAPHMHAHALDLLDEVGALAPGKRALDVGSGTGYLTACVAHMVAAQGDQKVGGMAVGIDHIPDLVESSHRNVERCAAAKALQDRDALRLLVGDGRQGYPTLAPFDAIHVGAASPVRPRALIDQLAKGGRLVVPVGVDGGDQELLVFDRDAETGEVTEHSAMGVRYVPLCDASYQLANA